MTAAKPVTTLERLRERVPDSYIKQRRQGGANISFIEWHVAAELLDERAPGWSCEIKQVGEIGGKVFVRVALTVEGVTRENIGYEDEDKDGYGDPFSNAYAMAFKRAATLFGLARHLYSKPDASRGPQQRTEQQRQQSQRQDKPSEPIAKSMTDLVTPKQLTAVRAIANANGFNAETECLSVFDCRPEELSRAAASWFIDHLKGETPREAPRQDQRPSGPLANKAQIAAIQRKCDAANVDIASECQSRYGVAIESLTANDAIAWINER